MKSIRGALIRPILNLSVFSLLISVSFLESAATASVVKYVVPPAPEGHFDEVYFPRSQWTDPNVPRVRPEYADIIPVISNFTVSGVARAERQTYRDFRGDNVLSLVPRIILDSDYDHVIKPGVDQRGRALRAFLQDFHGSNGNPRIVREALFDAAELTRIVERSGEKWTIGRINPDLISIMYGPDIIRDNNGVFRVVEDNTGFLGGFGDLKLALESLYSNVPYPRFHERDPMDFYKKLIAQYRGRAFPEDGAVVMLMVPPYADNEDLRLRRILVELGIEVITPFSKSKIEVDGQRRPWLTLANGDRKRVGFIMLNGEHWWMDMRHADNNRVAIYEYSKLVMDELETARRKIERELEEKEREARAAGSNRKYKSKTVVEVKRSEAFLKRLRQEMGATDVKPADFQRAVQQFIATMQEIIAETGLPDTEKLKSALKTMKEWDELKDWESRSFGGIMDAIMQGKVSSNYSPGTNFVNDKEFYTHVEDIVRFYLNETPILRNIHTVDPRKSRMRGGVRIFEGFDEMLAQDVARQQREWVIKVVDGRGGKGIWVGPKVSSADFAAGISAVRSEPFRYKYQTYTGLSVVGDTIVDGRVHSDIPPKGPLFVSDTAWGRGLPLNGDGKVNLSASGKESTIVVRSAQKFCEAMFLPVP